VGGKAIGGGKKDGVVKQLGGDNVAHKHYAKIIYHLFLTM